MSDLTICNRCDLTQRVRVAERRGASIEVVPDPHPSMPKGVQVWINGEKGPYYAELTDDCAC